MATFSDLPSELMAIIAEMLVSEKAYASCAAINQTCHAALDATSPIPWHTIDFMFTIGGEHPDQIYVSGRRHERYETNMDANNRLRDYVRLMFNELWAKSAACQRYTEYILLPLSPFHGGDGNHGSPVDKREWERETCGLDYFRLTSLKAIVIAEIGSINDRFEIYLGAAFQYGTRDLWDLIVTFDPEQGPEIDALRSADREDGLAPLVEIPNGLYLTAGFDATDANGRRPPAEDVFFDSFTLLSRLNIDSKPLEIGGTCCQSARVKVEVDGWDQLESFLNMFTKAIASQPETYPDIALCVHCQTQSTSEKLATILRRAAGAFWQGQNHVYRTRGGDWPYGSLVVFCGKNRSLQGALERMTPDDSDMEWEWDDEVEVSPIRLTVSNDNKVQIDEKYAPNLLREPEAELEAV